MESQLSLPNLSRSSCAELNPPAPACQGPSGCGTRELVLVTDLYFLIDHGYKPSSLLSVSLPFTWQSRLEIWGQLSVIWVLWYRGPKPHFYPQESGYLGFGGTSWKSTKNQRKLNTLLKPSWSPSGTKRLQKVSKMEPKVGQKGTLKWDWTPFL